MREDRASRSRSVRNCERRSWRAFLDFGCIVFSTRASLTVFEVFLFLPLLLLLLLLLSPVPPVPFSIIRQTVALVGYLLSP